MIGNGGIAGADANTPPSQAGVIFFKGDSQGSDSSDTVFSLSNAVVNGVAFYDLVTVGETGRTKINFSNGQGCTQFISSANVSFSNVRLKRCAPPTTTPDPATLTLVKTVLGGGPLGVSDFPLEIIGPGGGPVTSGVATVLDAGDYQASETTQNEYLPSEWGGDCEADGSVSGGCPVVRRSL